MTNVTEPKWLTTKQIAARLQVSRATLYRYLADGLPSHQAGGKKGDRRYDPDEVDEWIRSRCFAKSGEGAA